MFAENIRPQDINTYKQKLQAKAKAEIAADEKRKDYVKIA